MAYIDWNIFSQCEASFKGQNCEALNDQDPLKPKDLLKPKDGHESKRTIPHVCGGGDISQPSEPFDPLTHDHILPLDWWAVLWCREERLLKDKTVRL